MALLLLEGFDWMDTGLSAAQLDTAMDRKTLSNNFTSGTDATTVAGVGGNGTCLKLSNTGQSCRWPFAKNSTTPVATDEVGFGVYFMLGSTPINADLISAVDTNGTSPHMGVWVNNGAFAIKRGSLLIEQTSILIQFGRWYYLELKQVVNDSTGSWTFRIDGTTIASASSVDTRNAGNGIIGSILIGGGNLTAEGTKFDDMYAFHNNGGDVVDFLGPIHVGSLHPDADGDDEAWTTSAGTDSFALVNETAPHDDDTDYIESSTSTNRTLFTYDNVLSSLTSFHGIHLNTVVRETDASPFTLINTLKQGVTLYPESAEAIAGQTYENIDHVLDQDPDTALDWTESGINALQAGVEVG